MNRFFGRVKGSIAIIEEDFNHFKAKRVKKGELIEVINEGDFHPYLCEVEDIGKRRISCKVLEKLPRNVPLVEIVLLQCIPVKLQTMDLIVEKVTEIGVSKLVPLISKRSFQNKEIVERKLPRWERIAKETLKQCGRHKPLMLGKPVKLENLGGILEEKALKVFPFERENGSSLFDLDLGTFEGKTYIVVGPEGGFSKEEVQNLEKLGFFKISLGNFILRAETAAIAASALLYNFLLYHKQKTQSST